MPAVHSFRHDCGEVAGAVGAVDRPAKAFLIQQRQPAVVVAVGRGQVDSLEVAWREVREGLAEGLCVVALPREEQAAVHQELALAGFEQVAGAGHPLGGPAEGV